MFYRPNFCCECGEKIERTDWRFLTSRRFCEVCEPEKRVFELLPRVLIGAGAFAGLLAFSGYLQSRPAEQSTAAPRPFVATKTEAANTAKSQATERVPNQSQPQTVTPAPAPVTVAAANPAVKSFKADEDYYYCGAATKKGTPCSRRVKGNVRCWQHAGMPAMLPASQLKVKPAGNG
jgi:hypothetical protein